MTPEPQLQPPGAGLPWYELATARLVVFPLLCRRLSWAAAGRQFQEEGAAVLKLWDAFPAERLAERVLIRRLRGIEDSSRFWSVAMTVEHLNIVGHGIRRIIAGLRVEQAPARAARVEDVKPRGEMPPAEVRAAFVQLLADAAKSDATEPAVPRGTGLSAPHPWFGPLDAHHWHCLLGLHQGIHRKQVGAIRAKLPARSLA